MKKISFVTGSRADYGIVRNYLRLLNNDPDVDLSILVTGALLDYEYGHQVDLIYKDGFRVEAEIEIPIDASTNKTIIHAMARCLDGFGEYFLNNRPDLLIILGDRYEMLSVATAAAMNRIPILHIHGGEATYGNYDEFIRHSITKMSLFHFTATEEYRNRVIQLGEDPDRVFNLGALGAENCLKIDEDNVSDEIQGFRDKEYFVVLFHPETLTSVSAIDQIEELIRAIDNRKEYSYVFIGSNADTSSTVIRERIKKYYRERDNCFYYENLPTNEYHYLLSNSLGLIGNSSSGLIEAPSLGTYTINIGDRQRGRIRGDSVIDVRCDDRAISDAIEEVVTKDTKVIKNPYYKDDAAENYYKTTLELIHRLNEGIYTQPKEFYDLELGDTDGI